MKVIIAGSRTISKELAFYHVLNFLEPRAEFGLSLLLNNRPIAEFVTGDCSRGADQVPIMIEDWWGSSGYCCHFEIRHFAARWNEWGRKAGPLRNEEMAKYADQLILIWDGKSPGSRNMKENMQKLDKPVHEVIIKQ